MVGNKNCLYVALHSYVFVCLSMHALNVCHLVTTIWVVCVNLYMCNILICLVFQGDLMQVAFLMGEPDAARDQCDVFQSPCGDIRHKPPHSPRIDTEEVSEPYCTGNVIYCNPPSKSG